MSQYGKSAFDAYYNNTTGPLRNDIAGNITGLTLQQFAKDIADSVLFKDSFYDTDTNSIDSWDWWNGGNDLHGWTQFTSGAGSTVTNTSSTIDSTKHANGVVALTPGTTAAGIVTLSRFGFGFGYSTYRVRYRHALSALSNGTDRYTAYIGFGDTVSGSGDMTNGIYFKYNDSINSGKWQAVTANGGSRTATDTGVAADTNYHIFEIQVNAAGTSVGFYIDGVLKVTTTTNIPVGNVNYQCMKMEKALGTTLVYMYGDWYDLLLTRTSAR